MAQLFAGLQARNVKRGSLSTSMMSSETMQQGLRVHGLFNFTASTSDVVSGL
jgi:hypothetical protein